MQTVRRKAYKGLITYAVLDLYDRITDKSLLVRRLTLSANHVICETEVPATETMEQLDLFYHCMLLFCPGCIIICYVWCLRRRVTWTGTMMNTGMTIGSHKRVLIMKNDTRIPVDEIVSIEVKGTNKTPEGDIQ